MKRRTPKRLFAAVGAVVALLASSPEGARAATVSLNPSKDNTLFEDGSGLLSNGAGSAFFVGVTQSGLRRRGLLAFDLASLSLPTNAQVSNTTLSLYDDKAAQSPAPLLLRRTLKNWGEGASNADSIMGGGGGAPSATGDATWTHTFYSTSFWTSAGGDYSAVTSASANMMVGTTNVIGPTAQMNSDVQGWISNPATNFGWTAVGDELNFATAMRISSRENATASLRPVLAFTYNTSQWISAPSGTWSGAINWNYGVPNALGAEANFNIATAGAPVFVTVDGGKTLGILNFDGPRNYTFTGGAITMSRSTASPPVQINVLSSGTIESLATTINVGRDMVTTVASGSSLALAGGMNWSPGVSLTANGSGGQLSVGNVIVNTLTIGPGHRLNILANGTSTGVSRATTIANSGKLNLNDNHLITPMAAGSWNGSAYTGITGQVAMGKGTGNLWDGSSGIITLQSAAIGTNYTTLGVARASDVRPASATTTILWAGQTITGTDTLVMYTYGGDANLDGKLNVDDYIKIDSGIAASLTGWSNGDFNYDGKVNIDDYTTVIDANIGNQSGVFITASGGVTAVPEPLTIGLIAPLLLLNRRRLR